MGLVVRSVGVLLTPRRRPRGLCLAFLIAGIALMVAAREFELPGLVRLCLFAAGTGSIGAAFAFFIGHALAVVPALLLSGIGVALAGILSLAQSYEQAVDELAGRTRGDLMLTRAGRDFIEYRELARRLSANKCVTSALPFVAVEGIAVATDLQAGDEPPRLARAVMVRGMRAEDFEQSRVFRHLVRSAQLHAPRPADRERLPEIWLGTELARTLGTDIGSEIAISVRAREALRRHGKLEYSWETRDRRFLVSGIVTSGDFTMDASVALTSLSAAQSLAHGQDWVSGIDLEVCDTQRDRLVAFADELKHDVGPTTNRYQIQSWRHHASRATQRNSFRAAAFVIMAGLIAAGALSVALGNMVLVRLRRGYFEVLWRLGATRAQRQWIATNLVLAVVLGGTAIAVGMLCAFAFGAPVLSVPIGDFGDVVLRWRLKVSDYAIFIGVIFATLLIAIPVVRADVRMYRSDR